MGVKIKVIPLPSIPSLQGRGSFLGATEGSVAISMYSTRDELAAVGSFPRCHNWTLLNLINALYNHLDLYALLLLRIPRKMGAR
jgi:hypothetical protein